MTANLLVYGQILRATLASTTSQLQNYFDGLLKAENVPVEQPQKSGLPVWVVILIVVGVVICLVAVCIFLVLLLLGPSIGSVFSNMIETI